MKSPNLIVQQEEKDFIVKFIIRYYLIDTH